MRIGEWKKHFAKKLSRRKDKLVEGDCFDFSKESSVEKQLSNIKGGGMHIIFYFRVEKLNETEAEIKLISENIYVDEPQYL
jgi:hypothetical protein